MTKIRCAVYTRKSSESGLEQDFNSLDAQREAGEAYIKSQKHESWVLNPKQYNDGGFSGGNMDRPALKQLLDDIKANKIDVVVVYKVDRLSRSLHDFAKLVATFDENDVTFVSVTQSFNTKDSMGRLTLNMLLSFAQFEREVTGERMRRDNSTEAWFQAEIPKRYINAHTEKIIKPGFELHPDKTNNRYIVRRKKRFDWSGRDTANSIVKLVRYHKTIRLRIVPIFASENRWYLKKFVSGHNDIPHSQLVLIFAAMHRLSELSRYEPLQFSKHFNVGHNWLLSEFINTSPNQFLYGIASEITGLEFIKPDAF